MKQRFCSSKWFGIDYQQLVDIVLMPCLENPDLSIYAKPIIQQYVDALRMPYKGKREKLATIEEERILIRSNGIFQHHSKETSIKDGTSFI